MPYSPTVWVNGTTPAINATNLNKLKNELASQAAAKAVSHSLQNWVNGAVPAVSDQTNLDEMERVAREVSLTLPITAYVVTDWSNGWVPARNAANLNKLEIAARDNRAAIDAAGAVPGVPTGLAAVAGNAQVQLNWSARPAGENVDVYQVFEADEWVDNAVVGTSKLVTTNHLGNPLVNGTAYNFRVGAHNSFGYSPWSDPPVSSTPNGPAPPGNRYTNINFSGGVYDIAHSVDYILLAYQSDPRINSDGGMGPACYDNPGSCGLSPTTSMTTDPNQRVHLFHPASVGLPTVQGSTWASWQEIRTTDGPWNNQTSGLAKASIDLTGGVNQGSGLFDATWGGGGGNRWPGFTDASERWFAWDILFPLNIGGVSTEFSDSGSGQFTVLGFLHDSGGTNGCPIMLEIYPGGNSHPKYLGFGTTKDQSGNDPTAPFYRVPLEQLTNADGTRFTANYNIWHEVVVGHRSGYDTNGWQEVWSNGVQKLPRLFRANLQPNEGGPYIQLQNYVAYPTSYLGGATRSAVVYGGFRAGMTRADVQTR